MLVMHDLDRRIGRGRPASVRGGDPAVLLMGFAGAHRRGELAALTLQDVVLHPMDGLHVPAAPVEDPSRRRTAR